MGRPKKVKEPNPSPPPPQEVAVTFRESTTRKKMGRPRKVEKSMIEELERCSHLNTADSDNSFHQKKLRRVTFSPQLQIITLERISELVVQIPLAAMSSPKRKDHCLDQASGLSAAEVAARFDDSPDPPDEVDSSFDTSLVKVDEYRVKKETAPLLKSILAKQGNIAMHCVAETSTNRSSLLENVCGLYRTLEKKDPKRIKVSEVKSMLVEVGDFEKVGLDVKWLKERLSDIAKALEESKDYSLMEEEVDKNNEDAERKSKEVEEHEAKTREARNELAAIEARGMELKERISNTKAKWVSFCEQSLVEGLL